MTVTFNYEMYTDHYGTTLWCEEYANKPHFNKFWRWGIDGKICGELLNNKPNMKKLMKRYLADGEVEMEKTSYKNTKSSFRGDAKIQKRTIMNSITESFRPHHNNDIETIDIVNRHQLDKIINKYNDYTILVNKPLMNISNRKYKDVDNFVEYDINSKEFDFAVRRLESSTTIIVAKINHYDKTIMIYSSKLSLPTFESYKPKRLNENFNDIVSEIANYVLSNNHINGKTSLMTIDRLIRDAYFDLYGEEMEMDNRDLYRAIRDEVMFNKHSLRESYDEDLKYEMGEFIKAAQKMRGTYSAKSSNGKLKVGDKVAYERPSGWYEGVISDFSYNPMTGEETVDVDYWNEAKKSKWTMIGLPMSKVKKI